MQRGGEDSANADLLHFNVSSNGVDSNLLAFMITFENSDSVSIGSIQDSLLVEVVNPAFFSSADSGLTVP